MKENIFRAVLEEWPKAKDLAEELGERPNTIIQWKRRGTVPSSKWLKLLRACRKHGVEVGLVAFAVAAQENGRK